MNLDLEKLKQLQYERAKLKQRLIEIEVEIEKECRNLPIEIHELLHIGILKTGFPIRRRRRG